MSIEIWQFPKATTKDQLVRRLRELGYAPGKNIFWPGPPGTVSLFWAEGKDYLSISGVDASVFPLDRLGKTVWKCTNDWALRTRTSVWASSFDKEFQNKTVRSIRKAFGGTFYNDHNGHNRYIPVRRQHSTPASRGIYGVLTRVTAELDSLEHALPPEVARTLVTPTGEVTEVDDKTGIFRFIKQHEPNRVIYNALVPFLLAAIEHFFAESFEILLKYDPAARWVLEEDGRKVSFAEALGVAAGKLTVESIASRWYSFQNLDSIQKAFKEPFGIDVWKALRRRKKIRRRLPMLDTSLQNLIGARHGVIHHFSLDRNLDREGLLDLLHLVRELLRLMAKEIERKLGVKLGPG
jgi:hypothetical protein